MNQILDVIQLYKTGSILSGASTPGTGSIFTSGSVPSLYFKNRAGNIYNLSDTGSYFNILEYTSSATYKPSSNVKLIKVVVISGGGGGGSGALGLVGSTVTGGTGGAGSGISIAMFTSASLIGNSYSIVVGGGGPGALAITTPNTNGGNASNGTQSTFSTGSVVLVRAYAGGGGANGNTSTVSELGGVNNVGTAPLNLRMPYHLIGIPGFNVAVLSGRIVAGTSNSIGGNIFDTTVTGYGGPGMGGGGAGGHMSSSGVYSSVLDAKSGSNIEYNGTLRNGNTPGSWGTGQHATTEFNIMPAYEILQITGSISYTPKYYFGGGGAGGGSSDFAGTTGGGSGSVGSLGCGGGGGGGSTTGSLNRSGRGGAGGGGYVAILEYF